LSEATVRASIKTLIEGVANAGLVYDLEPFASDWDVFISRFKTTISSVDMIRGWTISCEAIPAQGFVATGARNTGNQYLYEYHIRGYQSFDYETETEKAFLAIVLDVMAALNGGIVSGTVFNADLAQLTSYTPRTFGGVLCHVAEITQIVREQI
jgi:hypothetical protein